MRPPESPKPRAVQARTTYPSCELDHREVGVVVRLEYDDRVARIDQTQDRAGDCLGAAGGDHHLGVRIEFHAKPALVIGRLRLA